ncbi:MAG: DUF551 domain-containing protein [Chloroflexi bacterium]|nr:DUF551 domain-containing protein [Chloroflexota bacterium]
MDWISVDERMPECDGAPVIAWGQKIGLPAIATFLRQDDRILWRNFWGGGPAIFENVTHWMPLPDPPEEGKHGA